MFDVGRSSFKTTPYGINAPCERLQNNLTLMVVKAKTQSFTWLNNAERFG
jgi:hypothetical protein